MGVTLQDSELGTVEVIAGSHVYWTAPDQQDAIFLESEDAPDVEDLIIELRAKALEIKQRVLAAAVLVQGETVRATTI